MRQHVKHALGCADQRKPTSQPERAQTCCQTILPLPYGLGQAEGVGHCRATPRNPENCAACQSDVQAQLGRPIL
jgi:hypothetical protein